MSFTKPATIPEFCRTGDVVEPVSIKKDAGWEHTEKPARQYMNWLHRLTYQWIQWFDQEVTQNTNLIGSLAASNIVNDSVTAPGSNVKEVLDNHESAIEYNAQTTANLKTSEIANDSSAAGATVKDALNALDTEVSAATSDINDLEYDIAGIYQLRHHSGAVGSGAPSIAAAGSYAIYRCIQTVPNGYRIVLRRVSHYINTSGSVDCRLVVAAIGGDSHTTPNFYGDFLIGQQLYSNTSGSDAYISLAVQILNNTGASVTPLPDSGFSLITSIEPA